MSDEKTAPGLRLVWDQNAEIDRIMTMPDAEVRAEMIADGLDPDEEVAKMREFLAAIWKQAHGPNA